jgi:hypothetical protein
MKAAFLAATDRVDCFAKVPRRFAKEKAVTLMDTIEELREVQGGSCQLSTLLHVRNSSLAKRTPSLSNATDGCYVQSLSARRSHGVGKMKVSTLWFK